MPFYIWHSKPSLIESKDYKREVKKIVLNHLYASPHSYGNT